MLDLLDVIFRQRVSQQLRLLRSVPLHSRFWSGFGPGCGVPKGGRAGAGALRPIPASQAPMVGARSIRVVVASVGMARSAAKSGISVRNSATTIVNSSSSPASCARVLDHDQRGTAHQPPGHRIERDVPRRRQQMRLVHNHRAKATLEQMARPSEPMLIAAV
jgi:hypothetical protein